MHSICHSISSCVPNYTPDTKRLFCVRWWRDGRKSLLAMLLCSAALSRLSVLFSCSGRTINLLGDTGFALCLSITPKVNWSPHTTSANVERSTQRNICWRNTQLGRNCIVNSLKRCFASGRSEIYGRKQCPCARSLCHSRN